MEILDYDYFRVTRDADFTVSDEADDLLQAVEHELRRRRFGEIVRVEIGSSMNAGLRDQLVEGLGVKAHEVFHVEGLLDLGDLWQIVNLPGLQGAARPAVDAGDAAAPAGRRRPGGRVRRHARRRPARAPPLRLLRHLGRALRRAGRRRPRRAGDQADRVPDLGRLAARPRAHPRVRARQAGGVPGRAQGPLRRAREHPVGQGAGGGGRARHLRHPVAEDPRQGDPRRAPRGRRRAPLRAHRDRQLPPQDRAAVHRLRPVHHRRGDRRRRRRPVQLPHRLRAPARLPQGAGRPGAPARRHPRARSRARSSATASTATAGSR